MHIKIYQGCGNLSSAKSEAVMRDHVRSNDMYVLLFVLSEEL